MITSAAPHVPDPGTIRAAASLSSRLSAATQRSVSVPESCDLGPFRTKGPVKSTFCRAKWTAAAPRPRIRSRGMKTIAPSGPPIEAGTETARTAAGEILSEAASRLALIWADVTTLATPWPSKASTTGALDLSKWVRTNVWAAPPVVLLTFDRNSESNSAGGTSTSTAWSPIASQPQLTDWCRAEKPAA